MHSKRGVAGGWRSPFLSSALRIRNSRHLLSSHSLEGKHYGPSADVFSFAIVMSELASLRQPYSDHLKDENGKWMSSWESIVEMTKKISLRPTLPEEMDPEFKALIEDCWNQEPSLRPSFAVVLLRLQAIGAVKSVRKKPSKKDSPATALCRVLNRMLWNYREWDERNEKLAMAVIAKHATVTARDKTLAKVLGSERGPKSIKSLGWMMFGGIEDGAELRPEPLLDSDIVLSPNGTFALLNARFALLAPKKINNAPLPDQQFAGLEAALQASEKSIESWGTEALEAVASAGQRNSRAKKKKKKKKKKTKKDARVEKFIKAARFIRGYGAAAIHPNAKIKLHGLRMQALEGDCPAAGAVVVAKTDKSSSASALEHLKTEAWRSARGKSQVEAMEEYLSLLTSLAPNWKVAHIVLSRESDEQKPRQMMWVLKVDYTERGAEERIASAVRDPVRAASAMSGLSQRYDSRGLQVSHIEILQSSNEANARLWSEEKPGAPKMASEASEFDKFIATLPKDFVIEDCIIDKGEHSTIEEQRAHYSERMKKMARSGCDEEDGWTFYSKTKKEGVPEEAQLDVYARAVEWSASVQMRTVLETDDTVEDFFRFVIDDAFPDAKLWKKLKAKEDEKMWESTQFARLFVRYGES